MNNVGGGGAPGTIRTCNLLIRSQMLYPLSYGRLAGHESNRRSGHPTPEGYQRLRTSSAPPYVNAQCTQRFARPRPRRLARCRARRPLHSRRVEAPSGVAGVDGLGQFGQGHGRIPPDVQPRRVATTLVA
jgi:hypothetical protein